ncbi:MAG: OmpA family protein [Saprospiraceae bacterium]
MKNLIFIFLTTFFPVVFLNAQTDAKGCEDHPLITRFTGAHIVWCGEEKLAEYHVAIGKISGYRQIDKWIDLEGQVFRYNYEIHNSEATVSEVYQNYRNALQRAGFELLANGQDPKRTARNEVGGVSYIGVAFIKNPLGQETKTKLFVGSSSSEGSAYIAAKLARPAGDAHIVVAIYKQSSTNLVVQVDIVEDAALEDGQISVDPDYIAKQIEAFGTVALYGIYFDFDKADIKPESKPDLDAVATYLKNHTDVNLYIVGHTDMKGTLVYNLSLSEKRAQAVVGALVTDYGISRARLEGKGVGPLSPKSHNRDETGRKLNRRVELVQKI